MLEILDNKLVTINKIKQEKYSHDQIIYFTYDGVKYGINQYSPYAGAVLEFYIFARYPINNKGWYEEKYIETEPANDYRPIRFIHHRNKSTLESIDIDNFIWELTWKKLVISKYTDQVERNRIELEKINKAKSQIDIFYDKYKNFIRYNIK